MPTMVMSQPPKMSGNTSLRKRQKNKNDNILAISYMYVGTPKKKFTFYVRERLVYRSNVEVTYQDVYNFLANMASDETISLHYSVNGLYVPITTTGQLHTFIHHVHNDPSAFLYVENQDYVWNVTPQNKSHKMEKRVPAGAAAPTDGASEQYDSMDDEEESQEREHGDDSQETEDENSQEDEEYEDEEEEYEDEDEPRIPPILTDHSAPIVHAEKIPVKEAFVEPKPRVMIKPNAPSVEENPSTGLVLRGNREDKPTSISSRKWTETEAFDHIKSMLGECLASKHMGSTPKQIAEELVRNVWNPEFPHNQEVLDETVSLLENSIGTGLLCYYQHVMARFCPNVSDDDSKPSVEKMMLADYMPTHDPEFIVEFIESGIVAACDMLECVQHLAHLGAELSYFKKLYEQHEINFSLTSEQNEKQLLPTLHEIHDHLRTAVTSAHFGFNVVDPVFPKGCECKEAIRLVTLELQKLLLVMKNVQTKNISAQQVQETKSFIIENAQKVIERYTGIKCSLHKSIHMAIRNSEIYKWRNQINTNYDQWNGLRENGENRVNIPLHCYDVSLARPPPFARKPENAAGDPSIAPIAHDLGHMHAASNPITMPTHSENPPIVTEKDLETTLADFKELSTEDNLDDGSISQCQSAPVGLPVNAEKDGAPRQAVAPSNVSATTALSTGEASGGGTATIQKKMSAELQKLVDHMYKNVNQHNYVYPPQPKPGAILIPTGGLARCRCSKNCPEFLMEPAYEYIERFNEPRQTVWEKTKQKRFKKN